MAHRESLLISEPLKTMEIDGFLLAERAHPPNWTLQCHAHESTMIAIILEGSCTEIIGRRSEACIPKSLQVLPAGEQHALKFADENVRCLTIEVAPQRLEGIRQVSKILDHPVHVSEGILSGLLVQLYREFRMMDSTATLTLEGLILEILGEATRQNNRCQSSVPPSWLRQAKDMIHDSALEGVSLVKVATSVGVHPTYLARMFRKFYGCSIGQCVRQVRIDCCIRELIESNKPLAEIASAAGFYDQSHFTNVFKLHLRMTPAEFRTALQGSNARTKHLRFSNTN
jgi:AraC family transcriptional regulator